MASVRAALPPSIAILLEAVAAVGVVAASDGATARPVITTPAAIVAALRVSPDAPGLEARPALVGRLRETPHNYFRFVNRAFTEAVCGLFDDVRRGLPDVSLHGDAHVEQYAVTSLGSGLTDLDEAGRGPYVVDLVRFGVSLELAARENGWGGAGGAIDDLLRGYRDALSNPRLERRPHRTIRRARAAFSFDHGLALRRAEALMDPVPFPPDLERDFQTYVTGMRRMDPALPARFFRIKKAGRLKTGIGSALDEKYLLRVEGWTDGGGDDQILEAKLVRPRSDAGCVHADPGTVRMSLGTSLVAPVPFPFSGLFVHGQHLLWVHGWTDDYVELAVDSSFPDPRDLRQVAYDVGTQLGRAHPEERPGTPFPRGLRDCLLESVRANERRIREAIDTLALASVRAWCVFRSETPAA
jgi:hypothetical protein